MSVNSYLMNLARDSLIRDSEKESINSSIYTLKKRLHRHFGKSVASQLTFGSYTRGTILPRHMDENSDVDHMIVFNDQGYKPQTYLNSLRKFVETYYARSEIYQSNPTIVLSLNHIKFELVPAINDGIWGGLRIPAKRTELNDWIPTSPNDLNQTLTNLNQRHHNLIKPMIRIVKYWNACNQYPFASFEVETGLVSQKFLFTRSALKNYVFDGFDSLTLDWSSPQWKVNALNRAKCIMNKVKQHLTNCCEYSAELEIQKLLPGAR